MKALIVDDSPYVRTELESLLAGMDFDTVEAKDGESALTKLDEERFDLVILDIVMEDLDGIAFLKDLQGYADTPAVVAVSALHNDATRDAAKELGVEHFVEKPFEDGRLKAVIREAVDQ